MDSLKITGLIQSAVARLFDLQPNIYDSHEQTDQTELHVAHYLAVELMKEFNEYDCDVSTTRRVHGKLRPDIIFHSRGHHDNDYLVIEIEYEGTPRSIDDDIATIQQYWFGQPYNYQYGAEVNLRKSRTAEVFGVSEQKSLRPLKCSSLVLNLITRV